MSLFSIADLHLSGAVEKPMDVFGNRWKDHTEKIVSCWRAVVSDDDTAVVGTINLDFRSLYLHFECATYMRDTKCIADIKADMLDMFENSCDEITYDDIESRSLFSKLTSAVLKPFAPLL